MATNMGGKTQNTAVQVVGGIVQYDSRRINPRQRAGEIRIMCNNDAHSQNIAHTEAVFITSDHDFEHVLRGAVILTPRSSRYLLPVGTCLKPAFWRLDQAPLCTSGDISDHVYGCSKCQPVCCIVWQPQWHSRSEALKAQEGSPTVLEALPCW
jgi:hypothetical protein